MGKKSENAVSRALGVLVLAVFPVATEAGALAAEAEPHTHVAIAIDPALDWEAVIAATLSVDPRGAELAARAAEAEAWGARVALALVAITVAGLAHGALAQTAITAVRVPGAGPLADAVAAHWKQARPFKVPMQPQVMALPHRPDPAVKELVVRAVHNGGWIAFLLEWKDPTLSNRIVLDNFGDQVALQLPVNVKASPPAPMMGNPGGRVNIMQWRAAFQRDIDAGAPTVRDLYPNAWADIYPDEVMSAADARPYTGALGLENPISRGRASPVLDQMAEGWGSMTVKPDQHALGMGVWRDGVWRVAITRPLVSDDLNAPQLTPGVRTVAAFAVWEGGHGEVGARKAWASWVPLWIAR